MQVSDLKTKKKHEGMKILKQTNKNTDCGFTIHKECREKLPTDIHCPFVAEGTTEEKTSK